MLYADKVTDSMQRAIDETRRRRACRRSTTTSTASRPRRSARAFAGDRRGRAGSASRQRRGGTDQRGRDRHRGVPRRAADRDDHRRSGTELRKSRSAARPDPAVAGQRGPAFGRRPRSGPVRLKRTPRRAFQRPRPAPKNADHSEVARTSGEVGATSGEMWGASWNSPQQRGGYQLIRPSQRRSSDGPTPGTRSRSSSESKRPARSRSATNRSPIARLTPGNKLSSRQSARFTSTVHSGFTLGGRTHLRGGGLQPPRRDVGGELNSQQRGGYQLIRPSQRRSSDGPTPGTRSRSSSESKRPARSRSATNRSPIARLTPGNKLSSRQSARFTSTVHSGTRHGKSPSAGHRSVTVPGPARIAKLHPLSRPGTGQHGDQQLLLSQPAANSQPLSVVIPGPTHNSLAPDVPSAPCRSAERRAGRISPTPSRR